MIFIRKSCNWDQRIIQNQEPASYRDNHLVCYSTSQIFIFSNRNSTKYCQAMLEEKKELLSDLNSGSHTFHDK